jgi:hypothetical protein
MKALALSLLICTTACANDWITPDFPPEPTPAQLLERNGLPRADEVALLRYVETNWESAGSWIPNITEQEEKKIASEYFRRLDSANGDAAEFLKASHDVLQSARLADQRRIVDATIRELGRIGTEISLPRLLILSRQNERKWVCWKVLASVQEILERVDPKKLSFETLMIIPADAIAPLLQDLAPEVASMWAWTLWEHHQKWLSVSFRSKVRLRDRIWMAGAFAAQHPNEAQEVFREGLQSQDPAMRTVSGMILRAGLGRSLPNELPPEQLLQASASSKWSPDSPLWDVMPLPLNRPLLHEQLGGRTDLIWLSSNAEVSKTREDVWPLIRESLPDGVFYSQVGDFWPSEFTLSDDEGRPSSRICGLNSEPSIVYHGGICALVNQNRVAEFHADGSVIWECPIDQKCRMAVSIRGGRVLLLGYKFIESRDRRGDLLWHTSLEGLDDPRYVVPIDIEHFLLSCGKSVGLLTRRGKYQPVLENLKSAAWIRYHPTEPWIIFDGGDGMGIVYDPKTKKELGRLDLDDGGGSAKSRFLFPSSHFAE